MKILDGAFRRIVDMTTDVPPETGGILGEYDDVICVAEFDEGRIEHDRYAYVPNVEKLNNVITQWSEEGIYFAGMFHSHPYPQTELSIADKEYIKKIMQAMPESVSELHFPVVVPGLGMTGHLAKYREGEIIIVPETIIIVKE